MQEISPFSDLYNGAELIDLYAQLAVAEQEIAEEAAGKDFLTVAQQLRERVYGIEP